MAQRQKLLMKGMNNPRGRRFAECTRLIEAVGFAFDRQRGSHRSYARADAREVVNV